MRPAVFLDRDGVLNELVPDPVTGVCESPLEVDDVRLTPHAAASLITLARAGYALVCVSNQPAAAKGRVSVARLHAVHARVLELLAREGAALEASRLCLHHPQGIVPALSGPCACRKPQPGMLFDVAAALGLDLCDSWMVGDTDADVAAGKAAGCRTLLIRTPGSVHKRFEVVTVDLVADNLDEAVHKLRPRSLETIAGK